MSTPVPTNLKALKREIVALVNQLNAKTAEARAAKMRFRQSLVPVPGTFDPSTPGMALPAGELQTQLEITDFVLPIDDDED